MRDLIGECDNLNQTADNTTYIPRFIKSYTPDSIRFLRQLVNSDRPWSSRDIEFIGCETDGQATEEMLEIMEETMLLLFRDSKLTLIEDENRECQLQHSTYEDAL